MHPIFSFVQLWKWFQQDCNTQIDIKSPAFGLSSCASKVSSPGASSTCHKICLISFEIYIKYSLYRFFKQKKEAKNKVLFRTVSTHRFRFVFANAWLGLSSCHFLHFAETVKSNELRIQKKWSEKSDFRKCSGGDGRHPRDPPPPS